MLSDRPLVAVIAFDQISPFHLCVPCVVFGEAQPGAAIFRLAVCSAEAPTLRSTAGFALQPEHGLEILGQADILIVPSWRDPAERAPEALLQALVQAHQRGAVVVGLCLGAFVLAQAGLLHQRRATTHWAYAQEFAQRFPSTQLDADVLYVEDGRVLTSAGTAAGLDCCLHLVRSRYGFEVANKVARRLVVAPQRPGGQRQFIEQPLPKTSGDARLSGLLEQVCSTLDQPHNLDALAAQAAMSRRSFTRHFKQLTGLSFGHWLQAQRLTRAQHLLESSALPVEAVATAAGFGSGAALRQHFQAHFGLSPHAWRQNFRVRAMPPQPHPPHEPL